MKFSHKILLTAIALSLSLNNVNAAKQDLKNGAIGAGYSLLALTAAWADYKLIRHGWSEGKGLKEDWSSAREGMSQGKHDDRKARGWNFAANTIAVGSLSYVTYLSLAEAYNNFKKLSPKNPFVVNAKKIQKTIASCWPFCEKAKEPVKPANS